MKGLFGISFEVLVQIFGPIAVGPWQSKTLWQGACCETKLLTPLWPVS